MKYYVVFRRAAGGPEKRPVARLAAEGPEDACRRAAPTVRLAAGEWLTAEPADELDRHEADLNCTARA